MTTHAYHQTKRHSINDTITALLTIVLVLSNVLLSRTVFGDTAQAYAGVMHARTTENHLLTRARGLELPARNDTYAPLAQDELLDEAKSILSPAAYLIYLLDFVSRSVEPMPDNGAPTLNRFEDFKTLFKQDFEALIQSDTNNEPVSYVECTNVVLENFIAELDGLVAVHNRQPVAQPPASNVSGARPAIEQPAAPLETRSDNSSIVVNEILSPPPYSQCGYWVNAESQNKVYQQFSDENLLTDLFDAYVRELGTSRREVSSIQHGSSNRQNNFVNDLQIDASDLSLINPTGTITLSHVLELRDILWKSNYNEAKTAVNHKRIADLQGDMLRLFLAYDREERNDAIALVFDELVNGISVERESEEYDNQLDEKRADARRCVGFGENCPSNHLHENKPMRLLRQLFQYYTEYLGEYQFSFPRSYGELDQGPAPNWLLSALATQKITPTLPVSVTTIQAGAKWDLVDDANQEYRIRLEGEDLAFYIMPSIKSFQDHQFSAQGSYDELDHRKAPEWLSSAFATQGITLTRSISITVIQTGTTWNVTDVNEYQIRLEDEILNIYTPCRGSFAERNLCMLKNSLAHERFYMLVAESGDESKIAVRQDAQNYAEERLWLEEEFDRQLENLAKKNHARSVANVSAVGAEIYLQAYQTWRASIIAAEEGLLSRVRTNLIALTVNKMEAYATLYNGIDLANHLFLDLSVIESQLTKPIEFAIGQVKVFVQAVQLGKERRYSTSNFDEKLWSSWLQSYGQWHSAMVVSNQPENYLFPSLRPNMTPSFRNFVNGLESPDANIETLVDNYKKAVLDYTGLTVDASLVINNNIYLFAGLGRQEFTGAEIDSFYTVISDNGQWQEWQPIPAALNNLSARPLSDIEVIYEKDRVTGRDYVHFLVIGYRGKDYLYHLSIPVERFAADDAPSAPDSQDAILWTEIDNVLPGLAPGSTKLFAIANAGIIRDSSQSPITATWVRGALIFENRTVEASENVRGHTTRQVDFIDLAIADGRHLSWGRFPILDNIYDNVQRLSSPYVVWGLKTVQSSGNARFLWLVSPYSGESVSSNYLSYKSSFPVAQDQDVVAKDILASGYGASESGRAFVYQELATGETVVKRADSERFRLREPDYQFDRIAIAPYSDRLYLAGMIQEDQETRVSSFFRDMEQGKDVVISPARQYDLPLPQAAGTLFDLVGDDGFRVYLDEYYLHIPLLLAEKLNEAGRYEEAWTWLKKVYDPLQSDGIQRRVSPALTTGIAEVDPCRNFGVWHADPFDPYTFADSKQGDIYLRYTILHYAKNLIDWGDQLYTMDSVESVNHARELYETTDEVLRQYPGETGSCRYRSQITPSNSAPSDMLVSFANSLAEAKVTKRYRYPARSQLQHALSLTYADGLSDQQRLPRAAANQQMNDLAQLFDEARELWVSAKNLLDNSAESDVDLTTLIDLIQHWVETQTQIIERLENIGDPVGQVVTELKNTPVVRAQPLLIATIAIQTSLTEIGGQQAYERFTELAELLINWCQLQAESEATGQPPPLPNFNSPHVSSEVVSYVTEINNLFVKLVWLEAEIAQQQAAQIRPHDENLSQSQVAALLDYTDNIDSELAKFDDNLSEMQQWVEELNSWLQRIEKWMQPDEPSSDAGQKKEASSSGVVTETENQPEVKNVTFPGTNAMFYLPENPLLNRLQWRVNTNLRKIQENKNFAGYERPLTLSTSSVQTTLPIYRYGFLLERARYLVSLAQQFEDSMLASIKEEEAQTYSLLVAEQDAELEKQNASLQDLRLKEAMDALELAETQKERARYTALRYQRLINEGPSKDEEDALAKLKESTELPVTMSGSIGLSGPSVSVSSSPNAEAQAWSSYYSMRAGYERRAEEWEYQMNLADLDAVLADNGIIVARDGVALAEAERNIAATRVYMAQETLAYLGTKFGNRELYAWMRMNLRDLFRDQLNLALASAKAAEIALEFETQTTLSYIQSHYWTNEREGLLGAERLRQDIEKMEQHRLDTATRKQEIKKTISLAAVVPVEFQRFKESGVLEFATLSQWFDYNFPGHYLRLIKDVRVDLVAIVPAVDGIHATLSNNGISRVMAGQPFEDMSVIYRLPETVAISSPNNATGLFEFNPNDPMLLPFEGSGLDTSWTFQMDKGANRFDYDSIYDIRFTIRYTALEDSVYRQKVLAEMGQDEDGYVKTEAVRVFSLANEFVDGWNMFHNPTPENNVQMVIDLAEGHFPLNEKHLKVKTVTLVLQRSTVAAAEFPPFRFQLAFAPTHGSATSGNLNFAEGETVKSTTAMAGLRPFGRWTLDYAAESGDSRELVQLENIVLVIEYEAKVHYN